MSNEDELHSVQFDNDRVLVRYRSAVDSSANEESINSRDIVRIVLERTAMDGKMSIHWYLQHRKGWTVHFNHDFLGADSTILQLKTRLGFEVPDARHIARSGSEGTVVWSRK